MIGGNARGQASLPALAIALLILSSVTVLSLAVADGALATADRDAGERHVATSVADRLVAADGLIAVRRNVLDWATLESLNSGSLRDELAVLEDEAVRITVGGRTVVSEPNVRDGTTVRRIVSIRRIDRRSLTPRLGSNKAVTLPRRTESVSIDLDPPNGTTIETVSANDRVLLHNASGLDGHYDVELSRFETARLRFAGSGPLLRGNVTLEYPVEQRSRATLVVTVDG